MDAAEPYLAEAVRHLARHGGGRILEGDGLLLAAGPFRYRSALLNAAVKTDPACDDSVLLDLAMEFFADRPDGFAVWVGEDDEGLRGAVEAAGLVELRNAGSGPEMHILESPEAPALCPSVQFQHVSSPSQLRQFAEIAAEAFATTGQPEGILHELLERRDVVVAPNGVALLATIDGEPVSCALVLEGKAAAGVFFVGTLEAFRHRGLGEAVTRSAAATAFQRGATRVVLFANERAVPVYLRAGFAIVRRFALYGNEEPGGGHGG